MITTNTTQVQYVTPETALKQAEQFCTEGNWKAALESLHLALANRRNKGNNSMLERLMVNLIDICVKNNNTAALRENLQNFRNFCQHTSMSLLEAVFKYLIKENNKIITEIENQEGIEKLTRLLSDASDSTHIEQAVFQAGDASPEEMLMLANCDLDELISRNSLLPKINFFVETYKIILDTLRQNSRLIDYYNQSATKLFVFCHKYQCLKEYRKVSEILHIHFNYILKASKQPELQQNNKIPYPVTLDDEECTTKLLDLRHVQLEYALKMEEWTDAFRTSESIFQLINRKKEKDIKQYLEGFFTHLASIFQKSGNHLFHTYALYNLQKIVAKNTTKSFEQKQEITSQLILSVLSVPINGKISNFQRLSTQYLPKDLQEELENSESVKNEILAVSQMLMIQGSPSRQSLFSQINLKNLHVIQGCPQISQLFKLIENEESPFKISKLGSECLSEICKKFPNLEIYRPLVQKTLAVRVLQKSKHFFANLNFETLVKHLSFFGPWEKVEQLLHDCNKEGLISVLIDHKNQVIAFDQELQLAENLKSFGNKLRTAFSKIAEKKNQGQERQRIFLKVKEKLEEETSKVQLLKKEMTTNKEQISRDIIQEMELLSKRKQEEENEKRAQFEQQRIKDEQLRVKTELMDQLNRERQARAREVLQELYIKGLKKIGNQKITELEKKEDELDYDTILSVYQNVLRKEKEQFDVKKAKKINDVEIWTRAIKEEEKIAMQNYCDKYGKQEMENIKKAIQDKHTKELATKKQLESAQGAFNAYKLKLVQMRKDLHTSQQIDFANKKGEITKTELLDQAKKALTIIEIKKANDEAERQRKQKALAVAAKEKAEGRGPETQTEEGGWGRGTKIAETKAMNAEFEKRQSDRVNKPKIDDSNTFTRGETVNKAEPKITKSFNDQPMSRAGMGSTVKEESKEVRTGPPVFTRKSKEGESKPEPKDNEFGQFRSNAQIKLVTYSKTENRK